jgi:hypothetical protein
MSDDFDKQDDDFDWLGDDDDDNKSSSEESGLTGELSWLQDAESSPDSKKPSQTDELDLDWLNQGDTDGGAPPSEDATGVTGELSWLSDDTVADSPDSQASIEDGDWVESDGDTSTSPEDTTDDNYDSEELPEPSHGLLDMFDDAGDDGGFDEPAATDQSPDWLSNMGETEALPDEDPSASPSWLSETGTFEQVDLSQQLDAIDDDFDDADSGQASSGDEDVASLPDAPDWLSEAMVEEEDSSDAPVESPGMPDLGTMFGFDDDELDSYDDDDVAAPVATDSSTEWMTQYDDDDEFSESAESVVIDEEADKPEESDTGWLEFDDSDDDDDDDDDPYAQYGDDDDDGYDDVFATDTAIDTDALSSESNLFDAEQPVSDPISSNETPDWLSTYDDDGFGASTEPVQEETTSASDTSDWLAQFGDETFDDAGLGDPTPDSLGDVPDWLSGVDDTADEMPDVDPSQFEDAPEMTADDLLADLGLDETISRVPTGFTGELDDVDDDISSVSTGLTGELSNLDDSDFDFLNDLDIDDGISRASTGLTGELSNLDDSDFDFLGELDIDDIDFDDLDLDDIALTGLTGELSKLEDTSTSAGTGATGDLQDDDDLDLSFLDDAEDSDTTDYVRAEATGGLLDANDDLDLSFLDDAEDSDTTDWFAESTEHDEDGEPDWMQTLDDVTIDDLMPEVEDSDFDDLLDDVDMDSLVFDDEELDAPVADLDSLLSTFDEIEATDFAEDDNLSQIEDLDAIFDAAMSQDDDDPDDLPENIPDWLRDIDRSSDETSAAAIISQQADKPIDELDDRLQALREKGLSISSESVDESAGSVPEVLSGVSKTLGTPEIAHEVKELISDVTLTNDQQKQAKLLQKIVGVTITPTVETDAEGVPIVVSSRRRRLLPNIGLGRLLVASILILVLILPFVSNFGVGSLPPMAFGADNRSGNAVFNQIESLNEGDWVLVGFEYGPTAAGELDSVADILLRHIFSQGAKPIIVSSNPVAIVHAQNIINDINQSVQSSGLSVVANNDYYIVRYLAGGTLGLRDLSQNLGSIVGYDSKGDSTNLNLSSLDEMALMLLIAERSDDIRSWAEQIAPSTNTRLVAATGYAAQPLAEPYVNQTDGIVGLVVGYRDAYTYGEMLQGIYATATPIPTATFTATATITPTLMVTNTSVPTETLIPTETEDSGADVTPVTVESDSDASPIPSETPASTETTVPTDTPQPTATTSNTATATATATNTPSPSPTPKLITVIVVTAPGGSVNVRTGPGTTYNVVTTVNTGDVFLMIAENDGGAWINFLLPDGREGWIASFLVEKTEMPEADLEGEASDDSASAGRSVTVMQVVYNRRMGKNRVRYSQQSPTETATMTGTPPTATPTSTPLPTFTPSVTPTATLTPTATPDPRANFAFTRDRQQENSRLNAMTLGTIAAVLIILLGNIFYGLRAMAQRRRESKR